jgi:hypothetical protein
VAVSVIETDAEGDADVEGAAVGDIAGREAEILRIERRW